MISRVSVCLLALALSVQANSLWVHAERSLVYKDMLYRYAVVACNVPSQCRAQLVEKLTARLPIDVCEAEETFLFHEAVDCIERMLLTEPDLSMLPSAVGRGCCQAFDDTSLSCRRMCSNALHTPTLSPDTKRERVRNFCGSPKDFTGDKVLLSLVIEEFSESSFLY